ncbi:MAG: hypothetical protein RR447_02450, partial [Algoriella sp.]
MKIINSIIFILTISSSAQETNKDSIKNNPENLNEVVLTGTMKPVFKKDSPVPIEVYTSKYFKTNPN